MGTFFFPFTGRNGLPEGTYTGVVINFLSMTCAWEMNYIWRSRNIFKSTICKNNWKGPSVVLKFTAHVLFLVLCWQDEYVFQEHVVVKRFMRWVTLMTFYNFSLPVNPISHHHGWEIMSLMLKSLILEEHPCADKAVTSELFFLHVFWLLIQIFDKQLKLKFIQVCVWHFSVSLQSSTAVSADGGGRRSPDTKSDVRLLRQVGRS